MNNVHFSSATNEWETPFEFFKRVNREFSFTVDVCATPENAKCDSYYTAEMDGLKQDWSNQTCWMNPPYGREIGKWIKKAFLESRKGAKVVCLVPVRTDTAWWHNYAAKGEVRFIKGRLKFGGGKSNAPFPSALVIFPKKRNKRQSKEQSTLFQML